MSFSYVLIIECVTVVLPPDQQVWIDEMRDSSVSEYNKLADISISLQNDPDWEKTYALIEKGVFRDGTHAFSVSNEDILHNYTHLEEKYDTSWHRSTETVMSENPYRNWLSKKRWPLNEELNIHMILFQQVKYIFYY